MAEQIGRRLCLRCRSEAGTSSSHSPPIRTEAEHAQHERTAQQRRYLKRLAQHAGVEVLASEEMER